MDRDITSRNSSGLWGLGLMFAVAIVTSAYIISSTLIAIKQERETITVKGYAQEKIQADHVTWKGTISKRGQALSDVFQGLDKDVGRFTQFVIQHGLTRSELSFMSAEFAINYKQDNGHATNEIEGYVVKQEFTVSSKDVHIISDLVPLASSLIGEGIEISSIRPEYVCTKVDSLKVEILGLAAADAFSRASTLATHSRRKVGRLRSAQQGVFQITPVYSTSVSDYGENDTTTIEKSIRAVVTMEFSIH
jgi:uncharacterized protein